MRLKLIALAAASAAIVFANPVAAQAQLGPAVQVDRAAVLQQAPTPRPRFVAEALVIHAYNETGWDSAGSDEVYAVFYETHTGQHRFTQDFGSMDSGDNQRIGRRQSCIAPLEYAGYDSAGFPPATWRCRAPGETSLDFRITLYEKDGWSPMACAAPPNTPSYRKNCDDDEIASFHQRYSTSELLALMPNVGDLRRVTTPTRGGYAFTFRLRRLPDAFDPPPVLQ